MKFPTNPFQVSLSPNLSLESAAIGAQKIIRQSMALEQAECFELKSKGLRNSFRTKVSQTSSCTSQALPLVPKAQGEDVMINLDCQLDWIERYLGV
jgi:hypothetical protein